MSSAENLSPSSEATGEKNLASESLPRILKEVEDLNRRMKELAELAEFLKIITTPSPEQSILPDEKVLSLEQGRKMDDLFVNVGRTTAESAAFNRQVIQQAELTFTAHFHGDVDEWGGTEKIQIAPGYIFERNYGRSSPKPIEYKLVRKAEVSSE